MVYNGSRIPFILNHSTDKSANGKEFSLFNLSFIIRFDDVIKTDVGGWQTIPPPGRVIGLWVLAISKGSVCPEILRINFSNDFWVRYFFIFC